MPGVLQIQGLHRGLLLTLGVIATYRGLLQMPEVIATGGYC